MNRVTSKTTPDGSTTRPVYNEANLLEELHVSVRGGTEQPVITNLDYNARGQRTLCEHANGATTEYEYDEETFRLRSLETTRTSPANTLQKLLYTYDPVGNITELRDQAATAPVFGTTTPVSGDGKYELLDHLHRQAEHPITHARESGVPPRSRAAQLLLVLTSLAPIGLVYAGVFADRERYGLAIIVVGVAVALWLLFWGLIEGGRRVMGRFPCTVSDPERR